MSGDIVVGIIKDVLVSIAAITATIVAIMGLYSWKRELHGREKYETARNLIRATFELREEIRVCRSENTYNSEFPKEYVVRDDPDEDEKAWVYLYKNRWDPVSKALINYDLAAIESEILLSEKLNLKIEQLRSCVDRLYKSIHTYIYNKSTEGKFFHDDDEMAKSVYEDIWIMRGETDVLSIKFLDAITGIENEIRPYLK